jgi:WD40 repeat protein
MPRFLLSLLGALPFAVLAAPPAVEKDALPLRDSAGDPLPTGAFARLGTVRLRHSAPVGALAYSADGKRLASASHDRTVRVWDAATGEERHCFRGHEDAVFSVAWTPDGKTLVSCGRDGTLRVWNRDTSKEARCIRVAPDVTGQLPAQETALWWWQERENNLYCVAVAPDGKTIAAACADGFVRLFDLGSGKEVRRLTEFSDRERGRREVSDKRVLSVAFSPDGKYLASGGHGRAAVFWEAATGRLLHRVESDGIVTSLAFAQDGTTCLAGTSSRHSTLIDPAAGKPLRQLESRVLGQVLAVGITPDGKTAISAGTEETICFWDAATSKERFHWASNERRWNFVYSLALSPDGKVLARGSYTGRIELRNLSDGSEAIPRIGSAAWVNAVCFSPDGSSLVSGAEDGTISLWDAKTGKPIRILGRHPGAVARVGFSADGKAVASGSLDKPHAVRRFDTTGKELTCGREASQEFRPGAFTPDGTLLVVGWNDATLRFWDLSAGKELLKLPNYVGTGCHAFTPDGRFFATINPGSGLGEVHFWDLRAADPQKSHRVLSARQWLRSLALSSDGRMIVTGGENGQVRLWEVFTGKERGELHRLKHEIAALALAPDGATLAAGEEQVILTRTHGEAEMARFQVEKPTVPRPVWLWDLRTGRSLPSLEGEESDFRSLAFSPDGKTLASTSNNQTALLWDMTRVRRAEREVALSKDELHSAWATLASGDAAKAYEAMRSLGAAPRQVVPFLRERLAEYPRLTERIARHLALLDDDRYAVREKATEGLIALGPDAEPALRKALGGAPSLEARQRIERVLAELTSPAAASENRRVVRAVEVLEQIATSEAKEVLAVFARGAADSLLTQEAGLSHERLTRRR